MRSYAKIMATESKMLNDQKHIQKSMFDALIEAIDSATPEDQYPELFPDISMDTITYIKALRLDRTDLDAGQLFDLMNAVADAVSGNPDES